MACDTTVSAVSGTFFVRAVGAHVFGWRWVLVVRRGLMSAGCLLVIIINSAFV